MNIHSGISQPKTKPSLLVIGYGNPTHGDDAIGYRIVTRIQALGLPNVETYAVKQLTSELSTKLARAAYAIFVDACMMNDAGVKVTPLDACGMETSGSSVPGLGHSLHPCSLLALTHSMYGHHPQSWWVQVPAEDFVAGHQPSFQATGEIPHAIQQIEDLLRRCMTLQN
jgi:hydrogenase maturation protease